MSITKKTVVTMNELRFPLNTSFSWDTPPGPIEESVTPISDPYPRNIRVQDSYGEGTIEYWGDQASLVGQRVTISSD